ncbi:SLAP domain-containing protein [Lacticaseibacillus saniviri]
MGKKRIFKSGKQLLLTSIAALALLGTGSVINTATQDGHVVRADANNTAAFSDPSLMVTRTIVTRLNFDSVMKDVTIKNVKGVPDSPYPAMVTAPKFAGYTTYGENPLRIFLLGPNTTYQGKSFLNASITQYVTPGVKHPELPALDPQWGKESGYINNQLAKVTYTIPSATAGLVYSMDQHENMTATSQKLAKGSKWKITQVLNSDNGNNWLNTGKNAWLKVQDVKFLNGSAIMQSYTSFYPVSTVTRNGGAHVYSSVNNNLVATSRVLPKGSSWATTAASNDWFNISGDQWLRSSDINNHAKTGNSTPSNKPATKVKINYVPGYSIRVWSFNTAGKATMTSKALKHGTTWRVLGSKTDKSGTAWYNLGGNQWIQQKYTIAIK